MRKKVTRKSNAKKNVSKDAFSFLQLGLACVVIGNIYGLYLVFSNKTANLATDSIVIYSSVGIISIFVLRKYPYVCMISCGINAFVMAVYNFKSNLFGIITLLLAIILFLIPETDKKTIQVRKKKKTA